MKAMLVLPLVSWQNGIWMIAVFALVVIILVAVVWSMISGSKKE